MEKEFPEIGEIVIVQVSKVLDYGAFADLLEYDNLKGFVHISQAASRWVKNIRNFVKENQLRAAQVLAVSREKQQVDLSLIKVSPAVQREKLEEFNRLKRAQKLLELFSKQEKKKFDLVWAEIAEPLIAKHGTLSEAFQQIVLLKEKALPDEIKKEWRKPFIEIVEKNVVVSRKIVKHTLSINLLNPKGVELIKKSLLDAMHSQKGEEKIEIIYSGTGKYQVKVTGNDFKRGESVLNKVCEKIISSIEELDGRAEILKD